MRILSRIFVIAVGLLAIGITSSSVSANSEMVGSFTLNSPTQWKSTVLPAGEYRITLARTGTDTNLLKVRGQKKALDILVFAQAACGTCSNSALKLSVVGNNRMVTSMDLPGFHMDFNGNRSAAQKEEMSRKAPVATEQVAVQVNSN
ncbi:MAG TPA: hypothetical protein VFE02_11845 [Candidatus Acidoferrales bacterium]|jgi:hypothetical protein|nr:hypothetical protein [Candidatus Acidoferrales bacterium]